MRYPFCNQYTNYEIDLPHLIERLSNQNSIKMRNLLLFATLLILASCTKEIIEIPDPTPEPESVLTYYPLEIGNYWIYQDYKIDSLGNETITPTIDSLVIEKDTLINGNRFFVMNEYTNGQISSGWNRTVRDSSNYIVNIDGEKIFSTANFSDSLRIFNIIVEQDTLVCVVYKMEQEKPTIQVPSGQYTVLNCMGKVTTFFKNDADEKLEATLKENNYYASNVGPVLKTYIYANEFIKRKTYNEKRLIRYHLN